MVCVHQFEVTSNVIHFLLISVHVFFFLHDFEVNLRVLSFVCSPGINPKGFLK